MLFFRQLFPDKGFLLIISTMVGLLLGACGGASKPGTTAVTSTTITVADIPTTAEDRIEAEANIPGSSNNFNAPSPTNRTETVTAYPTRKPASAYTDLEMITLLPQDAIQAIDHPQFLSAEEAEKFYDPQEMVMGVSFNNDSRAYSAPFLSNHEIVNDTVGGVKIAVTW